VGDVFRSSHATGDTLRHLTPIGLADGSPAAAPATAADPPSPAEPKGPSNPGPGRRQPAPVMVPGPAWQPTRRTRWDRGGVDVNDLVDQGETGLRRVYGSCKLPRLAALKDRWNPEHVVHRNHHIRPTDDDLARPEGGTMRRIINSTYVSLDGVIEHPEQWQFDYLDDATNNFESDQLFASDALLLGRRTYQSFAEAWPSQTGPFADKINTMPKYVASTTLQQADWPNTTIINGDLVQEVTKLKQQPGNDILMYGFGPVAQTLLAHGLLDEVRLWVHPVFVGTGSPSGLLFREGNSARMTLVDGKPLGLGIVILSYRPADDRTHGTRDR
jgi:dihydrofolate reductase